MAKSLFAGLMLVMFSVPVWSQAKIGYINYDKIWTHAAPFVHAKEKIEREFLPRDKELKQMEQNLIEARKTFDRNAASMAEAERHTKARELVEMDRDFQRKVREYQQDFNERQNEEISAGMDIIAKVVQQLAESEHYDLIVQDVVYVNPTFDLTERILKLLESDAEK